MYKTSWDLKPLLPDEKDKAISIELDKLTKEAEKFSSAWKNRADYLKSPEILLQALDQYEHWLANFGLGGTIWYYFHLKSALNQTDPDIKAKVNQINDHSLKLENLMRFFPLSISKIDKDNQSKFLNFEGLSKYKHSLENSFAQAKHLLSDDQEKIMSAKNTPAHENWVRMTSSFLSGEEAKVLNTKGKLETKSFSQIVSLSNHKNKKIRDSAAKAFNNVLAKYVDVAENEINAIFGNKKNNDELRNFPRPDSSRHLADNIETPVVDSLVATVTRDFDIAKRYYKLKAKLLGLPKLAYHERGLEYGSVDLKYTFEQSTVLLQTVFSSLDDEFVGILNDFLENGKIDVFPKKGKTSGAFCVYDLKTSPTYVMLNHTDKLNDVLTFAHEMGHGINDELMKKKQNALNFGTPLSTAEVASTFMEDFVLQELLKKANDETRLALMMTKLNDDISSIFRQVACYNFETELHSQYRKIGYLSKKEIGKIFQKHMSAYMGPAVEQSEGSQNWWVYWSHIRTFFYVYSYASGLLISKSMQAMVKTDPRSIDKVKEFLSAGQSDSPKNIFAKLGIDITDQKFWEKGIGEVESLLNETETLAKKLNLI